MKTNKVYLSLALGAGALALLSASCRVSIPRGAEAVKPFDKAKYLGKWYEIARLDFKYEKNLNHVTATYTEDEEGLIKVDNRGFDVVKGRWKNSVGTARPVRDPEEGRLKVSFFGPFYAGYNVIAVDPDYRYALVVGNNLKYMWILSREKTIPETVRLAYLNKAKAVGYDIDALVWTKQD